MGQTNQTEDTHGNDGKFDHGSTTDLGRAITLSEGSNHGLKRRLGNRQVRTACL